MSVATVENQSEMLEKVQTLSKVALDVYVKDLKNGNSEGLHKLNNDHFGLSVQTKNYDLADEQAILKIDQYADEQANRQNERYTNKQIKLNADCSANLKLDEDVLVQLLEMQKRGIDVNRFLRNALKKRSEIIEQKKEELSKIELQKAEDRAIIGYPASRHISTKIKRILIHEFGTKCSAPDCNKPSTQLHHQKPFAIYGTHDPNYIKPLCRGHHELQHCYTRCPE